MENYSSGGNYFRMADNSHGKELLSDLNHYLFCSYNHDRQCVFGDRCCLLHPRLAAKKKVGLPCVIPQDCYQTALDFPSQLKLFFCVQLLDWGWIAYNKLKSLIAIMLWRTWSIVASSCPHQQLRLSLPHISVGQVSRCYALLVRARSRDCSTIASGLSNSVVQIR